MASMRQRKAKLNRHKLGELKHKNHDVEVSKESLQEVGDELVRSARESYDAEVAASSPMVKKMATMYSEVVDEFFKGFKQGVNEEIAEWIKSSDNVLKTSTERIARVTGEAVTSLSTGLDGANDKQEAGVDKLVETIKETTNNSTEKLIENSEKLSETTNNQTTSTLETVKQSLEKFVENTSQFIDKQKETLESVNNSIQKFTDRVKGTERFSSSTASEKEYINTHNHAMTEKFLGRNPSAKMDANRGFATKAARFGALAVGGAFSGNLEKFLTQRFEESDRKESFVQNELKLRGLKDTRANKKMLRQDYKEIQKSTGKLQKIEDQAKALKEQGYTDEQINKTLGYDEKRTNVLARLTKADPTLATTINNNLNGGRTSSHTTSNNRQSSINRETTNNDNSSINRETTNNDNRQSSNNQTLNPSQYKEENNTNNLFSNNSTSEETTNEQNIRQEKTLDNATEQTKLLSEILKVLQAKGIPTPGETQDDSSLIPTTGLLGTVGKLGKSALGKLGSLAKRAAPIAGKIAKGVGVLAAGDAVFDGVSELAEGKKVESMSEIVPEGWNKLNPFAWSMRGGMYAGEKINEGVEAVTGGETVGTLASSAVDKMKGMLGLSNNETKIEQGQANADFEYAKKAIAEGKPISKQLADKVRSYGLKVPENLINQPGATPLNITNNMVENKPIPPSVAEVAPSSNSSPVEVAKEIGKNINISVPPPTVVGGGGGKSEIISQPFTNMIKNNEPSVSDYLRSRYV